MQPHAVNTVAEKAGLTPNQPPMIPGLELVHPPDSLSQLARTTPRPKQDGEAERLRALLTEALQELQALRALLG